MFHTDLEEHANFGWAEAVANLGPVLREVPPLLIKAIFGLRSQSIAHVASPASCSISFRREAVSFAPKGLEALA